MQCTTCHGVGFMTIQQPQLQTVTSWVSPVSGKALPQREGGVAVHHKLPTGRTVGISVLCCDCQGSGKGLDPDHDPACHQCHGTGERNAWDSDGDWVTEQCVCHAPAASEVA